MLTRKMRVFVASPGDVTAERDAVSRVVERLNRTLGPQIETTIDVVRWETHAWPGFGSDAQSVINEQIGSYDIFVGIMWTRLGTPTARAASGTVEEFERGHERWLARRVPHLMFYFSRVPFTPAGAAEAEQLLAVMRFKEVLESKGLLSSYVDLADFESRVHDDLYRVIQSLASPPQVGRQPENLVLTVPTLPQTVHRASAVEALRTLYARSPLVSVEGLGGSGKTFLVADSLRQLQLAESTVWYDAAEGSTLSDALTQIGTHIALTSSADLSKAKELVQVLERTDSRLVIDDFQICRHESFAPLLDAASKRPPPVRVMTISREYVELPTSAIPAARLTVSGLGNEEIAAILAARGLTRVPSRWVDGLETKLGGLPIAVTLFASAVSEFGHDPDELLADTMMSDERLRAWLRQILEALSVPSRALLRFLSAASGTFDRSVVRMACRRLQLRPEDRAFESLQRAHLVVAHSNRHWSVHELVAAFCIGEMRDHLLRRIHGAFGDHYLTRGVVWPNQPLDDETFGLRVIACRHLQSADRHTEAQELLTSLAATAKARGHYDSFVRLCEPELEDPARDPWLDYHYAHCCLTLGRLSAAERALRKRPPNYADDPNLELQLARLEAEVLFNVGDPARALRILTKAKLPLEHQVRRSVLAQACGTEARIRLELGQTGEVQKLALELLAESNRSRDQLGAAIAMTYLGLVAMARERARDAAQSFTSAVSQFRAADHRRGLAWALAGLARASLATGDQRRAILAVRESLRIRSDIAECSPEYADLLQQVQREFQLRDAASLVDEEERRVRGTLESERRAHQTKLSR